MDRRENIIEKIGKLLAKAESAGRIGSQAEAEAFAAKASELMILHQIESADLADVGRPAAPEEIRDAYYTPPTKRRGRRQQWIESMASELCRAHSCFLLVVPSSTRLRIVGHASNREAVTFILDYLTREGERLSMLHERHARTAAKLQGLPIPEAPKRAFELGFASGVVTQLRAARARVVEAMPTPEKKANALMVIQNADRAVLEFVNHAIPGRRSAGRFGQRIGSHASFNAGVASGRQANVSPGRGARQIGGRS